MYRRSFIICLIFLMALASSLTTASEGAQRAAPFRIASGDGSALTLEDISGKIVLCFYETRETKDRNRALKDELEKFRNQLPDNEKALLFVLPVVDCSGASRLFLGKWKDSLVMESEKAGHTVYGDWDGKMRNDFSFVRSDANFALIDADSSVVYQVHGTIEEKERTLILRKVKLLMGKETLF
ncbi:MULTISPECIES: hypothetical protein [Synergistaceae]|jgi:hypothetical protein|uniref:hypothetical protein n=1 Tax=Synergistaceae TaxID=649777 RepID=UPI003AED881B|nr:hypothetical protein [Synergistaceae bacterium DZ-S4]